eukprot:scaffold303656_cov33-Attheya_sp.AAC.1
MIYRMDDGRAVQDCVGMGMGMGMGMDVPAIDITTCAMSFITIANWYASRLMADIQRYKYTVHATRSLRFMQPTIGSMNR